MTNMEFDLGMLYNQLLDTDQQLRNWSMSTPQPQPVDSHDLLDSSTLWEVNGQMGQSEELFDLGMLNNQ